MSLTLFQHEERNVNSTRGKNICASFVSELLRFMTVSLIEKIKLLLTAHQKIYRHSYRSINLGTDGDMFLRFENGQKHRVCPDFMFLFIAFSHLEPEPGPNEQLI